MRIVITKTRLLFLVVFILINHKLILAHSEAYFSPEDHPARHLIKLIDQATHKVHAAIYMFTNKQIAQALINAKRRKVDVKIVVDKVTLDYEYGKGDFLRKAGIPVYLFDTNSQSNKKNDPSSLMHNKFAIIDSKVWTGSFNWTRSADWKNQENVIVTTNERICTKFENRFESLRKQAFLLESDSIDKESSIITLWEQFKQLLKKIPIF